MTLGLPNCSRSSLKVLVHRPHRSREREMQVTECQQHLNAPSFYQKYKGVVARGARSFRRLSAVFPSTQFAHMCRLLITAQTPESAGAGRVPHI